MKVLIAEDDAVSRRVLQATLDRWGFEIVVTRDGDEARAVIEGDDVPKLAILDWMMPGVEGPELCRLARRRGLDGMYVILLTAKHRKEDIVEGLRAGADDYITKPFNKDELHARLQVGVRMVELQTKLGEQVAELREALRTVKQLRGMLPICCYCKKIRDDSNYWKQVEEYLHERSDAEFTHGICPDCLHSVIGVEEEEPV